MHGARCGLLAAGCWLLMVARNAAGCQHPSLLVTARPSTHSSIIFVRKADERLLTSQQPRAQPSTRRVLPS
jgi:hypothetical protein